MVAKLSDITQTAHSLVDSILALQSTTDAMRHLTQVGVVVPSVSVERMLTATQQIQKDTEKLRSMFDDIAIDAPEIQKDAQRAFEKAAQRLQR